MDRFALAVRRYEMRVTSCDRSAFGVMSEGLTSTSDRIGRDPHALIVRSAASRADAANRTR
jgi:hypothetical protein